MSSQRIVDLRSGRTPRREAPRRPHQRERERRSPLRARRRKARLIAAGIFIVLVAILAYGIHWISYLPKFSIIAVRVEGVVKLPPETVIAYTNSILDDDRFHYFSRRNIFSYPRSALERALTENFPRVESVVISRTSVLSDELVIEIKERDAFAKWCGEGSSDSPEGCYWMDVDGFIFAEVGGGESAATRYTFTRGLSREGEWAIGATFAPTHVAGMVETFNYMEQAGFVPSGASVENEQDFFVYLDQGFYVKASFGQNAAQLGKNLELVMNSEALRGKDTNLEYIDLRFGNRVYYKFKGEAEVSAG